MFKTIYLNRKLAHLEEEYKTVAQCESNPVIKKNYLQSIDAECVEIERKLGIDKDERHLNNIIK